MVPVGLNIFLGVVVFVLGAVVGSFLNVCIHRMPHNKSIVSPPSHCTACQSPIAWYDNIPLVSWFVLRGKCRHCGAPFSFRYWLVELLTAVVFLGVWLKFGPHIAAATPAAPVLHWRNVLPTWQVPIYWLLLSALIVATFIDLEHYIIPDEISIGGVVAGFLLSCVWPALHGEQFAVAGAFKSILGIVVGSALVLWLAIFGELIFKKEAMGFGDVKFMGMIGAFLGWQAAVFTLIVSSFAGTVAGLLWIRFSRERRAVADVGPSEEVYHSLDAWSIRDEMDAHAMRSSIPYGPFLALGAAAWIFVGDYVKSWYSVWLGTAP